ncbi:MAG: oxidoreductase, partial [Roseivivax sp.]|nr:oxidoreductase [Roseivivax sp.]
MSLPILTGLLAPVLLLLTAAALMARPGPRPGALPRLAEAAAAATLALALIGLVALLATGPAAIATGDGAFALALRADAISATMTVLVAFIGWIVMRYARSYMDGEPREGRFHALMLGTLAAVLVLVQSGSLATMVLAFAAIGIVLRQLLLFYPERPAARRAAT